MSSTIAPQATCGKLLKESNTEATGKDDLSSSLVRSDRQIAQAVDANPTYIGRVRKQAEEQGDVSTVDTRKDTKGRQQPARKATKATAEPAKITPPAQELAEQQLDNICAKADFSVTPDAITTERTEEPSSVEATPTTTRPKRIENNRLIVAWREASEEERVEFINLFGDDLRRYNKRGLA